MSLIYSCSKHLSSESALLIADLLIAKHVYPAVLRKDFVENTLASRRDCLSDCYSGSELALVRMP